MPSWRPAQWRRRTQGNLPPGNPERFSQLHRQMLEPIAMLRGERLDPRQHQSEEHPLRDRRLHMDLRAAPARS